MPESTRPQTPPQPSQMMPLTPMMAQYLRMKDKAGEALLFFRMGDFYELFQEDAIVAAKVLNIALTSRHKHQDDPIPMCGVPIHSADGYIDRLIQQGYRVAICEQLEDPQHAQGLVERDIIRIITPGTVVSSSVLAPKEHNFLASIACSAAGAGFAYLDVSTGMFAVTSWDSPDWQPALCREYERVQPRELLVPEPLPVPLPLRQDALETFSTTWQAWDAQHFRVDRAYRTLTQQFAVRSLAGFGCEGHDFAIAAAGALLVYVQTTQQRQLDHVQSLRMYNTGECMVLDEATRRNLELFHASFSQERAGSLLDIIDHTVTAMGGRLLRHWLSQPLQILQPLCERQEAIAELVEHTTRRLQLRQALEAVADLERIGGRLALGSVTPRELVALRHSIGRLPTVAAVLQTCSSALLTTLQAQWDALEDIETRIATTLSDDPPASRRDGHVIRAGYHAELDTLRAHDSSGKSWLAQFELQERQRTGIPSLHIGFNKVFGYYIEVRKTHLAHVPEEYVRKQTLVNAERFITPTLKDYEVRMLRAEEHALRLEQELYELLRQELQQQLARLQKMASVLSQLDVLGALADVAVTRQYCRPTLDDSDVLALTDARHPVLEVTYEAERFVPNDILLDCHTHQILLLTGPNMAGKSTYMRQVALIVVLAQIGSFVPASAAQIGLVDRIFTRVGAQDMLAKGQSTFMVEMTETANILHNVSARSLVLLDEIGRGTSTYDGMSIAWAVIEYLHEHGELHPRTLFATHYHELTALAASLERVQNVHTAVREWGEKIVFLRQILPGSADRSYGIQVARLAGLPQPVIDRARQLLAQFETSGGVQRRPDPVSVPVPQQQLSLFANLTSQLLHELRTLALDDMSPREALHMLVTLQQRAQNLP